MKMLMTVVVVVVSLTAAPFAQSIEQYKNVKVMVQEDGKSESTDAVLSLEPGRLVLHSKKGTELKVFPYASITSAEYSYAKSPRWKSALGLSVVCLPCGVATAFMKGKKHWLTVSGAGEYAVIQLDKDNYKLILPALQAKSGITVATVADEK